MQNYFVRCNCINIYDCNDNNMKGMNMYIGRFFVMIAALAFSALFVIPISAMGLQASPIFADSNYDKAQFLNSLFSSGDLSMFGADFTKSISADFNPGVSDLGALASADPSVDERWPGSQPVHNQMIGTCSLTSFGFTCQRLHDPGWRSS